MRTLKAALLGTALSTLGAGAVLAQAVDLPPNAKPGQCFARVLVPAQYAERTEKILVQPISKKIETVDAKYEVVEKRILVEEASEKLEIVPAVFKIVDETVIIKAASEKLVSVPASFATVEEKVLVKPSYSVWRKSCGPLEKVDSATGETICLIEEPAEYEVVKKQVMQSPASTKKETIAAVTTTIKVKKMVEPPKAKKISIPAKYKTIKIRQLKEPAREIVTEIPAKYSSLIKRTKISDSSLEWRSILCEASVGKGVIKKVQQALRAKGYKPGKADGVLGRATMRAVDRFQKANGLASGQLTIQTIKSLGISL